MFSLAFTADRCNFLFQSFVLRISISSNQCIANKICQRDSLSNSALDCRDTVSGHIVPEDIIRRLLHSNGKQMTGNRFSPVDFSFEKRLFEGTLRDRTIVSYKNAFSILYTGCGIFSRRTFVKTYSLDGLKVLLTQVLCDARICLLDLVGFVIFKRRTPDARNAAARASTRLQIPNKICRRIVGLQKHSTYGEHSMGSF